MSHKAQPPVFAPIKSPPPAYNAKPTPPLAVTFRETGGGPSQEEQCTIEHIRSFLGSSDFDEDLCLKAIRHPRLRSQKTSNEAEYLQEVVGVYMDELNHAAEKEQQRSQTPRPTHGCANRPMQTIEEAAAEMSQHGGAVNVPAVACTATTASSTTPIPALPSAAEREQSDIEKAIAESLISQGPPGNRSYVSSLPSNPEDMLRKEGVSVGLHNTGNTCWFNVVAQLLFHLPRFRRIVYEYEPRKSDTIEDTQNAEITEADLVERMRYLFASMDLGNRRYIDPSEALNVVSALAARSRSDVILGRQQDASEMMSSLMDWMEKGLGRQDTNGAVQDAADSQQSPQVAISQSVDAMETSPAASVEPSSAMDTAVAATQDAANSEETRKGSPTPSTPNFRTNLECIQALFHGYQAERARNDVTNSWSKLEYTSLFPIHVSHGNLHDALEAHQFLNDSGKEPWFESLPAVLIFSLGRYFFNGTKGETEKLNMRFHFPRTIYMDRYMSSNYENVSQIREARNQLRNQLANVRAELKGLNEFPIGDRTDKLVNIIRSALNFAKGAVQDCSPGDKMDVGTGIIALPGPTPVNKQQSFVEEKPPVTPSLENPQQLSNIVPELEKALMELESNQKLLRAREQDLLSMIDDIYERDDLKQHGYRLHAVAIHQGQANAGHYWAYVRKGNDDSSWEKFNDQRVESASWNDIEAEAVGGIRTTSAYFLLYVSSAAEPWLFSDERPTSSFLMSHIREQVESENAALETEIERYRCSQNEDEKRNAEVYEPFGDRQNDSCSAPPPIGNPDEMLSGTPMERSLADPENLAVSLSTYCEPWYPDCDFSLEQRKLSSVIEYVNTLYPQTITHETIIENQAKIFYRTVLKPLMIYLVQTNANGPRMDASEICNKVISSFYDESDAINSSERTRPLRCLLDFWTTLGFRAPAKAMRYAMMRAFLTADAEEVVKFAREELDQFESVPFADHYIVYFQRASHFYDLARLLWHYLGHISTELNHYITVNLPRLSAKFIEMNVRSLKLASIVTSVYQRFYTELGTFQGAEFKMHADFICPSFIVRGVTIIPLLSVFATIVQFLVDRVAPREETLRLLVECWGVVEYTIHGLAIWARLGFKDAQKIISHIKDTLGMITQVFPTMTIPVKREISRRLNGATQPDRHYDAPVVQLPTELSDICYEVEQAACQLSLLGLADETEADNVYTRLMSVVSDIINNAMQVDDRAAGQSVAF